MVIELGTGLGSIETEAGWLDTLLRSGETVFRLQLGSEMVARLLGAELGSVDTVPQLSVELHPSTNETEKS